MATERLLEGMSGREASMLRRRMLSQGKAALPKASERVRSGFRDAALPDEETVAPLAVAAPPGPKVEVALPQTVTEPSGRKASIERRRAMSRGKAGLASVRNHLDNDGRDAEGGGPSSATVPPPAAAAVPAIGLPEGGRAASVARRRALSQGKAALPPAKERVRAGFRDAALPPAVSAKPVQTAPQEAAMPPRTLRQGSLKYPVKVPSVTTAVNKSAVTGLSYARGRAVTGTEAGRDKPLTGTQYVAGEEGGYRASLGKVGHARTQGGLTVSGTMVRSTVRITGDEDSADVQITGNADQTLADDLAARDTSTLPVGAQFARQTQPHGHSVFGTNLAHSASSVGSRSRESEPPVEQTLNGHAVSGTAIGRSVRVTGDESGAHRGLTGTQYLAPSGHQATQAPESGRADPATGTKVTASQTWRGQTITGPQMEHNERVTGSEQGTCQTLTGTPYYGFSGAETWCDPEGVEAEAALRGARKARVVTGDVPMHDPAVSGTHRGADRAITGSAYFVAETAGRDVDGDPVAQSIEGFSIGSPQRVAHLAARAAEPQSVRDTSAITGTFAQGEGKVTGNVEFGASPRKARGSTPARQHLTGEGSVKGPQITGSAWADNPRVTGTEGFISAGRNPSAGGEHGEGFAGARKFKAKSLNYDPVSPVTGATGGTPASCATVTFSGGAAG
ncbi:CsoS2 family carboxysome shell protein [Aquicoccus porphyridii]|uniref:CsoS2 family carboxysome shell protein n=1 Tax=Aquicoccus porphyridii TaxID=1852029 RepID=UPI00273F4198|nr:CsoS2 family carboxysome shell protein [Aquicoccus porphyridii]